MLVLSRRVGESIVIGDDITITVLEFRGEVVRIGVDAPRSVQVRRQELLAELAETNRAAASPQPDAVAGLTRLVAGAPGAATPRPGAEPTDAAQAANVPGPAGGARPGNQPGNQQGNQPRPGPRPGPPKPRPPAR